MIKKFSILAIFVLGLASMVFADVTNMNQNVTLYYALDSNYSDVGSGVYNGTTLSIAGLDNARYFVGNASMYLAGGTGLLNMSGVTDFNPGVVLNTSAFTVAGWFRTNNTVGYSWPFAFGQKGATYKNVFGVTQYNNLSLYFRYRENSSGGSDVNMGTIATGQWYSYVISRTPEGGTFRVEGWFNGTLVINFTDSQLADDMYNQAFLGMNSAGYPSTKEAWTGNLDDFGIWKRRWTASDVAIWQQRLNCSAMNMTGCAALSSGTNYTITATDKYTGSSLLNIAAVINGYTYNSTTGTITLPLLSNATSLYNIQLMSTDNGGYFNYTYPNVNLSGLTLAGVLSQSVISFSATEKVSGTVLSGVTFNTSYLTNGTHYMRAGSYSTSAVKSGYFTSTQTITAAAFENSTRTFANLSATRLNLTVRDALTNAIINSYSAEFNNSLYSYSETQSTTNGNVITDLIAGNWTIFVDASNYSITVSNQTLSAGVNNVTLYLYSTNSINFFFRDEITNLIINTTNITVQLIGQYASYNKTTSNGTTYIDLITPDTYVIRYNATSGYTTRFSVFTLTNRSNTNLTLYMLNNSLGTNVTATVIDLSYAGRRVPDAYVYMQKYDLASNSYITREVSITNFEGQAIFDAQINTEYYKFIVEYPLGTIVYETTPSYIYSNTITLPITTTESSTTAFNNVFGVLGNLTYNLATYNFRFTYVDTSNAISQACVNVYRVYTNLSRVYYNSSCSTSTSATLLAGVTNLTSGEFYAEGVVTIEGVNYVIDAGGVRFDSSFAWGFIGLFLDGILTIVFIFMFKTPVGALLALPFPTLALTVMGLISWPIWVPFSILIMSWMAAAMIARFS